MMRGGCAAAVALCLATAPGCGDGGLDPLDFEGETGLPIPAVFGAGVPAVTASLDGASSARFLLDTGAPVSLVDIDDHDLGQGWHSLDVELGDLRFRGLQIGALDLFDEEPGSAPFSGIIGGNLLARFALSLDPRGQTVWLEDGPPAPLPAALPPESVDIAGAIEVDARVAGGGNFSIGGETREVGATRFLVRIAVEDQDDAADGFWAVVDSGASSVVLSSRLVDSLGDRGRPRLDGVPVQTASGGALATLTRVWNLRLGDASGGEQTSVPVLVLPDDDLFDAVSREVGEDVRGLLGGSYLRWYVATFDYPGQAMRLLPHASADHIDADEFIGVGFDVDQRGDQWVIDAVFAGTDAEAQGVRSGDTLVELDGTAVAGLDRATVDELGRRGGVGAVVPVALERAGQSDLIEVEVAVEDLLPAFGEAHGVIPHDTVSRSGGDRSGGGPPQ